MADSFPLITIFNGRRRSLGGEPAGQGVFAQVYVGLLGYICEFSGSEFKVLMAIALHSNESGWAWPSRPTLARETGLAVNTVSVALSGLCEKRVDGQRVLLRYQPQSKVGCWEPNHYLMFPL